MILLNDTIKEVVLGGKYRTKYRATCDKCGVDRGYLSKQNALKKHCAKCCVRHTVESKQKMSEARLGVTPWNKGKKEVRKHVVDKLSAAKTGKSPVNKGTRMTLEQKIKLSCAVRGINLKEFDELQTPVSKLERNRFAELGLHVDRFELDNYTCDSCKISNVTLNAHHKNSWKHFPEQRFDINNLISLCVPCHKDFHAIYGNGRSLPNTEEQIKEFILKRYKNKSRKIIIVVAGVSGAGKSWVCNQLSAFVKYIPYDNTDKKNIRAILWNTDEEMILYDPTTHVSSFIKRNSDIFDIILITIQEDICVVEQRLISRNGAITDSIKRRINRMKNLAKSALFTGTSSEVLYFLQSYFLIKR